MASSFLNRPIRELAALLFAAVSLPAAGCGGSDSTSSRAASPTAAETPAERSLELPAPEVQAANIVGVDRSRWISWLTTEWGAKPTATWTATKEGEALWRAKLVLRGDDPGERISGMWLLRFPLDRPPTPSEIAHIDDAGNVEAVDAGARKLGRLPPLRPGGTVRLSGTLLRVDTTRDILVMLASTDDIDDDQPSRRGARLVGSGGRARITLSPDSSTRIIGGDGDPIGDRQLRQLARLKAPIAVRWKLDEPATSLADLRGAAPAAISIAMP